MASFLEKLILQNTRDIQGVAGHKLAKSMGAAQKKEKGWRAWVAGLKTAAETFLPPGIGHAVGAVVDPIGRNIFGKGAKEGDIKLDEEEEGLF